MLVLSRAESEMMGNVSGVTIMQRLCWTGVVSRGIHTGVEAIVMAAVVMNNHSTFTGGTKIDIKWKKKSFLT